MAPMSARPRQPAEPRVAQRSASWCETCSAPCIRRCSRKAWRTVSIRFELSLLAEPSTPRPTGAPGRLQPADRAAARGQDHVRGRAVADRDPGPAEPADLGLVEPDAVRQPDPVVEPADPLQIVDRPAAEALPAPGLLVLRLGEMGVQAHAVAGGEGRRCRASGSRSPRTASRVRGRSGPSHPAPARGSGRSAARCRPGWRPRAGRRLRGGRPPSSSPRLMLPRVATRRMPSACASSISMSIASVERRR